MRDKRLAWANPFWRRSLKTRVTLFTLTIFLVGLWSLAFYASQMMREDMRRLLGEQQFSMVSFIAAEVNQEMGDRMDALENVAGRITPAMMENTAALQKFLDNLPVLQGMFNGVIMAFRLDGTVIAEVPLSAGRIGVNYLDVDSFAAALQQGQSTIGRPVIGRKLGAPLFPMTVPIRDAQGRVIGALAGVTNLGLPNFLDKITENTYGKTGGYLLVAPQHRRIVTASDKSRVMEQLPEPGISPWIDRVFQGHEGTEIFVNPLGVEVLTSVKAVRAAGWIMAVALPTAEVFAPVHAMQRHMLLATLLMTLLAGGLTWWMLRRQLSPMVVAARTLATLSDANLPPRPLPITGQDEIGKLIGGFNRLLETLRQREEALKESETRYRLLADHVSDVLWVLNLEKERWVYISPSVERLRGHSAEEVLAQPVEHAMTAASYANFRTWIAERSRLLLSGAAGPHAYLDEVEQTRKDGSTVWTEMATRYIRNEQGELTLLGVSRDITERRRTEQQLKHLLAEQKTILNNELVGIVTLRDRKFVWANPAFEKMLGYEPGELVGTSTRACYPSEEAYQAFATAYPALEEGGIFRSQMEYMRKDGRHIWVNINGTMLDRETGETLWGFVDISDQVKMLDELKRSNAELEQFSYAVSHDMRQPLRMISSYLQLLGMELAAQLDGEKLEFFNFAIDGAKRLDRMLVALLEYSRVGRIGEPPAWVESRALLDDTLLILQPEIDEAQASLSITGDWPRVFVSRDEILRLLQNLIGNALKFRVAGRTPKIAIACETANRTWRISVSDNGVGIIPDQIGRLFQVFQRLQSRAAFDGTGIGLALCRKIAEHHGGRIWAESTGEGQGSTFRVELPVTLQVDEPTSHE